MNERRFYELIDVTGPLPSETNDQIAKAIDMLPSAHPARAVLQKAAAANSKVGQRIQDLRDWGAESFGDPARGIADPRAGAATEAESVAAAKRPRLTEAEREARADHPRLTDPAALRAVLTGKHLKDGKYWLPGIDDPAVAGWYVGAYAPGQGSVYGDQTYSRIAQMDDDELKRMMAKYPNPADWMRQELRNPDKYVAETMARTPTWPDLLRMAGRA